MKYLFNLHLFGAGEGGADGATAPTGPVAQGESKAEGTNQLATDKAKFEDLIEGDYKEDFQKKVEEIMSKRLRSAKKNEEQLNSIIPSLKLLAKSYGLDAESLDVKAIAKAIEDDDKFYEEAAFAAGMEISQYKEMERIKAQNAELNRQLEATREAEEQKRFFDGLFAKVPEVQAVYPSFDLRVEFENPDFARLVVNNVPLKTAYEVIHRDEILTGAMQFTAQKVQEKLVNSIQSGIRPAEEGLSSQTPASVKIDPSKLSKQEIEDIKKRVRRGEKITF